MKPLSLKPRTGVLLQTAKVTEEIMPGVIMADFGWWFPENEGDEASWTSANINMLTSDRPPFSPETGSACFRDLPPAG